MYVPPPISIFLTSNRSKYHREVHCLECGLPFAEITNNILRLVDNAGPDELTGYGAIVVRCKRCKQPYHFILGDQE